MIVYEKYGGGGRQARSRDRRAAVRDLVRGELGQQRRGQTSSDGVPVPHDGDDGAAAVNRSAERASVRAVWGAPRDTLSQFLLLARAGAPGLRQVLYHNVLAGFYLEGAYIVCPYRSVTLVIY